MDENNKKFSSIDKESMAATQRVEKIKRASAGSPLYGLTMIDPKSTPNLWNNKQQVNNTYLSPSSVDNGSNLYWHFTGDNNFDGAYANDDSTLEHMKVEYLMRVAFVKSVKLSKLNDQELFSIAKKMVSQRDDDSPGFKYFISRADNYKQLQKIFNEPEKRYFNQFITDDPSEALSARIVFDNAKMEELIQQNLPNINPEYTEKKFESLINSKTTNLSIKRNYIQFLKNAGKHDVFKNESGKPLGEIHILKDSIDKLKGLSSNKTPMNIKEYINEKIKDNPKLKKTFEYVEELGLGLETPAWANLAWSGNTIDVNHYPKFIIKNKNEEIISNIISKQFEGKKLTAEDHEKVKNQAELTPKEVHLGKDISFYGTDKEILRQYKSFKETLTHEQVKKITNLEALSLYSIEDNKKMGTKSPRSSMTSILNTVGLRPRGSNSKKELNEEDLKDIAYTIIAKRQKYSNPLMINEVKNSLKSHLGNPNLEEITSRLSEHEREQFQDIKNKRSFSDSEEENLKESIIEIISPRYSDSKDPDSLQRISKELTAALKDESLSELEALLNESEKGIYNEAQSTNSSAYTVESLKNAYDNKKKELSKLPKISPSDPNRAEKIERYNNKKSKIEEEISVLKNRLNIINDIRENINKSTYSDDSDFHIPINDENSFFSQYDDICNLYMDYMKDRYGNGIFLKWSAFKEDEEGNLFFDVINKSDQRNAGSIKNPYMPKYRTGGLKQVVVSVQYADGFEEIPQLAKTNLTKATTRSMSPEDIEYIKKRVQMEGLNKISLKEGKTIESPITTEEVDNFLYGISQGKVLVYRIDVDSELKKLDGTIPANLRFFIGSQTAQGRTSSTREMVRQVTYDGGETYVPLKGKGFERIAQEREGKVIDISLSNKDLLPGNENNVKYVIQRAMKDHSININEDFIQASLPSLNDYKPLTQDLMSDKFIEMMQSFSSDGTYVIAPSEQKKLQKYLLELNKNITGTSDDMDPSFQNEEETLLQEQLISRELEEDELEEEDERQDASQEVEEFNDNQNDFSDDYLNSMLENIIKTVDTPKDITEIDINKEITLIDNNTARQPVNNNEWTTVKQPVKQPVNQPVNQPLDNVEEEEQKTFSSKDVSKLLKKYGSSRDDKIKHELITILNFIVNKKD